MSFAITRYTGDGTTPTFTIGFNYRDEGDIIVKVNGVTQTLDTHYKVTTGGTIIDFSQGTSPLGAPTNGYSILFQRSTSQTTRLVDYAAGSVFKEADLDTDSEQGFFMAQEAIDIANESITVDANNRWDAENKRIINVADPVDNQDAVNKQFISTNLPNITTVAGIASDVTTVAGISSDVTAVAADATDIGTVATNISSVNTVATNIADVITVANDLNEAISEIETAADDLNEAVSEIDTVAQNITNVNTVGGISSDVTTVAGIAANVTTVAGVSTDIPTVAAISSDVSLVAADATDIGIVASDLNGTDDIGTVAANIANIGTVATNNANVTAVGTAIANVNTVAGNTTNINTVASNTTNINAVAADATDIGTVATNIANVNAVGGDIANVNTVASNLTDINAFADTYFISATAPASPTQGDLWFDTDPASLVMKVYDGSGWVNAGSSVNGTSERQTYTATGGQTTFAATYDAGYVDVYLNGVKLINGSDFTATNGTSIVLSTGATAGDTVDIVAYGTFTLLSTVLNDLSDVSTTGATSGQVLSYNGASWSASTPSVPTLSSLGIDNHDNLTVDASGNVTVSGTFTSQGIDDNATSTAMTLDASGNLLVGKTVSGLAYQGAEFSSTGQVKGTAPNQVVGYFNRTSSDGNIIEFRKDNSTVGSIGTDGSLNIGSTNTGIKFGTAAVWATTGGSTNSNGAKDLGAATVRWKDLYLSGGVYLGGTGSANHLDDYEEGTWTPAFSSQIGTITYQTNGQKGRYVKIGNNVIAWCYLNWSSISGNGSYGVTVTGLPFTSATQIYSQRDVGQIGGGGFENIAIQSNNHFSGGYVNSATDTATPRFSTGGGSEISMSGAFSAGGGYYYSVITYRAA